MKRFAGDSPWPDFSFWHSGATTSTMHDARALSQAGSKNGCVYADYQSEGRGRLEGRAWLSEPDASLLCTIWTETADDLASVAPLLSGAALLCAIEDLLAENVSRPGTLLPGQSLLSIKWPNDILWNRQKLAGILCERSGSTVFAGIGLNLGQSAFPGAYRTKPVSFLQAYGFIPQRRRILEYILARLWSFYSRQADWHAVVSANLAFKDMPVTFKAGLADSKETRCDGILRGLNRNGALLIQTASGMQNFYSGEITPVTEHSGD